MNFKSKRHDRASIRSSFSPRTQGIWEGISFRFVSGRRSGNYLPQHAFKQHWRRKDGEEGKVLFAVCSSCIRYHRHSFLCCEHCRCSKRQIEALPALPGWGWGGSWETVSASLVLPTAGTRVTSLPHIKDNPCSKSFAYVMVGLNSTLFSQINLLSFFQTRKEFSFQNF